MAGYTQRVKTFTWCNASHDIESLGVQDGMTELDRQVNEFFDNDSNISPMDIRTDMYFPEVHNTPGVKVQCVITRTVQYAPGF